MLRYWKKYTPATNRSRLSRMFTVKGLGNGKPYQAPNLTDVQAVWLAAAIDSEGFISINAHKGGGVDTPHLFPLVGVCNNDDRYIRRVVELVGENLTAVRERKVPRGYRTLKVVTVSRIGIADILEQVKPFLIVKQRQAEIVIQFCRAHDDLKVRAAYPEWFRDAFDEMRQLNKRGLRPELLEA
jgi:hypothetical protein